MILAIFDWGPPYFNLNWSYLIGSAMALFSSRVILWGQGLGFQHNNLWGHNSNHNQVRWILRELNFLMCALNCPLNILLTRKKILCLYFFADHLEKEKEKIQCNQLFPSFLTLVVSDCGIYQFMFHLCSRTEWCNCI